MAAIWKGKVQMRRFCPFIFAVMVTVCWLPMLLQAQSPAAQSTDQEGPSYKETVQWIQDNIKLAGSPPSSKQDDGPVERFLRQTENNSSSGLSYSITFDGCNSFTITSTRTSQATVTNPTGPADNYSSVSISHYKVPFTSLIGFLDYDKRKPIIGVLVKEGGATMSAEETDTDKDGPTTSNIPPTPITIKNDQDRAFSDGELVPFIYVPYSKPGSEDAAPHMTAALSHLVDICKNHPEQAPKSLF